jgi:hypothetical protein
MLLLRQTVTTKMKLPRLLSVLGAVLVGCNKGTPTRPLDPSIEALYAEWAAELQRGIVGVQVNQDGTRVLLGPGFSDAPRIRTLDSTKRLVNFRPRLEMVNYCIAQYEKGDPIAKLIGTVLREAFPGQLSEESTRKMFEDARRLAKTEQTPPANPDSPP